MNFIKHEKNFLRKMAERKPVAIELYLDKIEDLSDAFNPCGDDGLRLRQEIEEYLEERAKDIPIRNSLRIEIHLKKGDDSAIEKAERIIHGYYKRKLERQLNAKRKTSRYWRLNMVMAFVFLGICGSISFILSHIEDSSAARILQNGFEIIGWVAIWEPASYFLYGHREFNYAIENFFQLKNSVIHVSADTAK